MHSLSVAEQEQGFDGIHLLDDAARRRLPHMYVRHHGSDAYPSILSNWKGDATEGTPELLAIARGEEHPRADTVAAYQESMRASLPSRLPLVRGGHRNTVELESWSAQLGTASRYAGDAILFTVVRPEDVFMCSLHGPRIGEQEFVLTDAGNPEQYPTTLRTHVKLYQRMQQVLS